MPGDDRISCMPGISRRRVCDGSGCYHRWVDSVRRMDQVSHQPRIQGPVVMNGDLRGLGGCGTTSRARAVPGRGDHIVPVDPLGPGRPRTGGQAVVAGRRGAGGDRRGQGRRQAAGPRAATAPGPEIRGAGRLFLTHEADEDARAPGPPVRRAGPGRAAGRAAGRGPAPGPIFATAQARPPGASHLRGAQAGREAAGRRAGRDGAAVLARRYPPEAETMVRRLGPEGLTAVRVFGDDVAEVLVKEGPESLGVLRKAGRGGWSFFTKSGPAPQEEAGRRGRSGRLPGQPREVCRLRRPGHRVRRPRVCQGRHPARLGRRRRRGAGTRDLDRPGALPPTGSISPCSATSAWRLAGLVVVALVPGHRRAADPLDVPAVRCGLSGRCRSVVRSRMHESSH